MCSAIQVANYDQQLVMIRPEKMLTSRLIFELLHKADEELQ
jgi:hypothetical protein